MFLAALVQWRPRPDVSVEMAARALDQLERLDGAQMPAILNLTHRQSLETMTLVSGGRAHFQAGDYGQARDWLDRGLATPGATYPIWKVSGLGSLALLEAWCGNTERAAALSVEALAVAKEVGLLAHPSTADAYLASALVALETGEPGRASLSLHEGSLRAEANRRSQLSWFGHFEKALLQEADGHREQAMTTALSTRNDLGAPPPPIVASRLLALQLPPAPPGWVPRQGPARAQQVDVVLGDVGCSKVRRRLSPWASTIWPASSSTPCPALPDAAEPRATVERPAPAVVVGRRRGVRSTRPGRTWPQPWPWPRRTPWSRRSCGPDRPSSGWSPTMPTVTPAVRDRILRRAREVALPAPGADLVDPLTDRELEILSYLPSRFTNTELADHFYVSVNTIKTHMAHIYRKLEVANRNGAIARSRELGIL